MAACSGSGSTSSNNGGGGGNQGDATQLTFVTPNIVPSLPTASTSYVVVNNPTNSIVTGAKYQLGNIVGGAANVTVDPASSANFVQQWLLMEVVRLNSLLQPTR